MKISKKSVRYLISVLCIFFSFDSAGSTNNVSNPMTFTGRYLFSEVTINRIMFKSFVWRIINKPDGFPIEHTEKDGHSKVSSKNNVIPQADPCPTVDAGPAIASICSGMSYTLAGSSSNGTILWTSSGTGSFSNSTVNSPVYTPSPSDVQSGIVTLVMTLSGIGGCSFLVLKDSVELIINPNPIVVPSTSTMICENSSTVLTNSTLGGFWKSMDTTIALIDSVSGEVIGVSAGNVLINYTITDLNECSTTVSTDLKVNSLPILSTILGNSNVCLGDSSLFTNETILENGWSAHWKMNDNIKHSVIDSITGILIANNSSSGIDTIYYKVTTSNACSDSIFKIIEMKSLPLVLISASGQTTFCQGADVVLTANSLNHAGYQWFKNGNVLNGDTLLNITATSSGNYSVRILDSVTQCYNDDSILVTVDQYPVIASYVDTFCTNELIQINPLLIPANFVPEGTSYSWNSNPILSPPLSLFGISAGINQSVFMQTLVNNGNDYASALFNVTATNASCSTSFNIKTIIRPNSSITPMSPFDVTNQSVYLDSSLQVMKFTVTFCDSFDLINVPGGVLASLINGQQYTDTIIFSGNPSTSGTYQYLITLLDVCNSVSYTDTLVINPFTPPPGISYYNQTVCLNSLLNTMVYHSTDEIGSIQINGLPNGVFYEVNSDSISINGAPSESGIFPFTVQFNGLNGFVSLADTIRVNPLNTITLLEDSTDNQTVCINTIIDSILYLTTGDANVTFNGLPSGVSGIYHNDTILIVGTPDSSANFTYNIELTGECGSISSIGSIAVNTSETPTLISPEGTDHQKVCLNSSINGIIYAINGFESVITGLPEGVKDSINSELIQITGIPDSVDTFFYTISNNGTCGTSIVTGSIEVLPLSTLNLISDLSSDTQSVYPNTPIVPITYVFSNANGAEVTGLPFGVFYTVDTANVIEISGIPTFNGVYPYEIMLGNSCGNVQANGEITVQSGTYLDELNSENLLKFYMIDDHYLKIAIKSGLEQLSCIKLISFTGQTINQMSRVEISNGHLIDLNQYQNQVVMIQAFSFSGEPIQLKNNRLIIK